MQEKGWTEIHVADFTSPRTRRQTYQGGDSIAGQHEAPHTCKYCGLPRWIDPSDQSPPPDCCHEIDHGTAEDRAVFVSLRWSHDLCRPTS